MKRQALIIGLLIAALLAGGGYAWRQRQLSQERLSLSGNVDIREVSLSFRVAGRLSSLNVDEGASVRAGTVLGELDAAPYRNALRDAEAALAAAQARQALYRSARAAKTSSKRRPIWTRAAPHNSTPSRPTSASANWPTPAPPPSACWTMPARSATRPRRRPRRRASNGRRSSAATARRRSPRPTPTPSAQRRNWPRPSCS